MSNNKNPSFLTLLTASLVVIISFLIITSMQTNQKQILKTQAQTPASSAVKCPSGSWPKLVCPEIIATPTAWLKLSPSERQKLLEQKKKEFCNWQCSPLPTKPTAKPSGRPIPTTTLRATVTVYPWPPSCPEIICPLNCSPQAEPMIGNCPICHC